MLDLLERALVLALHIPDGFLSASVSALFWVLTLVCVTFAVRRTNKVLDDRQVPLMGVMAACIFAAQMLNFPVAGGTSGHVLGGALAAIVLGPAAGILVMTCVVALQALLFQDGGIVVMGANIFNMGVLTTLLGGAVFAGLLRLIGRQSKGLVIAGFAAAWVSVMAAAALTALQLIASGTAQPQVVLGAMLGVHSLIGVGEGLITAAALSFLLATRPDVLPAAVTDVLSGNARPVAKGQVLIGGLAIAALLLLLAPFASAAPDGLERVALDLGFIDGGRGPGAASPAGVLSDYTVPGLAGGISTILAGLVGVLIVVALGYGLAILLRRRSAARSNRSVPSSR
ncbi:MAG: cobalamin biosynthesis protein CbiM [Chloroflexi bacterium]|nr:MAG: cobalamin biosynthesis protein CbiM [Chloroflexota bacterium]